MMELHGFRTHTAKEKSPRSAGTFIYFSSKEMWAAGFIFFFISAPWNESAQSVSKMFRVKPFFASPHCETSAETIP